MHRNALNLVDAENPPAIELTSAVSRLEREGSEVAFVVKDGHALYRMLPRSALLIILYHVCCE